MKGGVELVALCEVIELGEGAERAVPEDEVSFSGPVGERDADDTLLVGGIFGSLQPDTCLGPLLVLLVGDPEFVSCRADLLEYSKVSLGHEGPAAFAVSDELDDVDSGLVQFRKIEGAHRSEHGGVLVLEHPLPGCAQAVEVDGRVDGLQVSRVVVEGVDFECLD